ncbi:MAG: hypothetical protein AAF228_00015 [Pseudomonadota bacterium]
MQLSPRKKTIGPKRLILAPSAEQDLEDIQSLQILQQLLQFSDFGKFCNSEIDVVNDLIRKAREIEVIRSRLIQVEKSGFIQMNREELLAEIKEEMRQSDKL